MTSDRRPARMTTRIHRPGGEHSESLRPSRMCLTMRTSYTKFTGHRLSKKAVWFAVLHRGGVETSPDAGFLYTDLQDLVFLTRFLLSEDGKNCSDFHLQLLCFIRENPCNPCPIASGFFAALPRCGTQRGEIHISLMINGATKIQSTPGRKPFPVISTSFWRLFNKGGGGC